LATNGDLFVRIYATLFLIPLSFIFTVITELNTHTHHYVR